MSVVWCAVAKFEPGFNYHLRDRVCFVEPPRCGRPPKRVLLSVRRSPDTPDKTKIPAYWPGSLHQQA
jgi:hypothetical protein